jgi:hypothetical protein
VCLCVAVGAVGDVHDAPKAGAARRGVNGGHVVIGVSAVGLRRQATPAAGDVARAASTTMCEVC